MDEPAKPFDMSALPFGQWGPMLDSVERFNKTWSSLSGIPSRMLPTVDVEELGQRITELKAVEQWLTLNLNVLRNTIQGMAMQRDALSAVKAFGASMGETPPDSAQPPASPWAKASEAFKFGAEPASAAGQAQPQASTSPFAGFKNPFEGFQPPEPAAPPDAAAAESSGSLPPSMNPGLWWTMLQHNFSQVAEAALAGVARPATESTAAAPSASEPAEAEPAEAAPFADAEQTAAPAQEPTERTEPPSGHRPFKSVPLVRPSRSSSRTPR